MELWTHFRGIKLFNNVRINLPFSGTFTQNNNNNNNSLDVCPSCSRKVIREVSQSTPSVHFSFNICVQGVSYVCHTGLKRLEISSDYFSPFCRRSHLVELPYPTEPAWPLIERLRPAPCYYYVDTYQRNDGVARYTLQWDHCIHGPLTLVFGDVHE